MCVHMGGGFYKVRVRLPVLCINLLPLSDLGNSFIWFKWRWVKWKFNHLSENERCVWGYKYVLILCKKKKKCITFYDRDLSSGSFNLSLICYKDKWLIIERTRRRGDSNEGNPIPGIEKVQVSHEMQVCQHNCWMWYITAEQSASQPSWLITCFSCSWVWGSIVIFF